MATIELPDLKHLAIEPIVSRSHLVHEVVFFPLVGDFVIERSAHLRIGGCAADLQVVDVQSNLS